MLWMSRRNIAPVLFFVQLRVPFFYVGLEAYLEFLVRDSLGSTLAGKAAHAQRDVAILEFDVAAATSNVFNLVVGLHGVSLPRMAWSFSRERLSMR